MSSHDPKMIAVFEVLGSYFTDTIFNHLYNSARTRATAGKSISDEYVRQIHAYVVGVKGDKECYNAVIRSAHQYFATYSQLPAMGYGEFVNRIVGMCVPAEYFRSATDAEKDELLGSIVCDLVASLTAMATTPDMLRAIIDNRAAAPTATIRTLQDAATTALITNRARLHNMFLKKVGQARDQVPLSTLDAMKRALRKLLKEKAEAVAEAAEAREEVQSLKKQLREAKTREAKMRKIIELIRIGRDHGPEAAAAYARTPPRDTIAEEDPLERKARAPPRRETIAEHDASDNSDSDDNNDNAEEENDDDEESGDGSDEESEEKPKRGAGKKNGIAKKNGETKVNDKGNNNNKNSKWSPGADFFKSPAAKATPDLFAGVPSNSSAAAPAVPARPPPSAMASLLNGGSDDLGDEELDTILA